MLDVSTASPTREATSATALVTRVGSHDLEVRVWPPEDVWAIARRLDEVALSWEAALPDESGLPGSLVLRRDRGFADAELAEVVSVLDRPGVAALGYLPADTRGACRRVPGAQPQGRDRVVFVELRECAVAGRWQVRAYGALPALRHLHETVADLAGGRASTPADDRSVTLELAAHPDAVHRLVQRLDDAGLDGHVRVLRRHQGC